MKKLVIGFGLLLAATSVWLGAPALAQVGQAVVAADPSRLDLVYVTSSTKSRIAIGAPLFSMVGKLPKLELDLVNQTGSERRLEYLVEWYAEDGSRAQTNAMWHSIYLLPHQHKTLRSMGEQERAFRARVSLRETSRRPN